MAGAGYKLFNTGDVLTAAQVNTYLMEQTVMVFANAAARTTALSGVVSEGMISYLKDTNAVEVYDGSNWVSSDDPNAIQNTIVDAKGDLISASAADVPARLAVGNNGETLVADSSATTGLRWTATPSASNPVINGAFDIWQRGTSVAVASNSTASYTADRWYNVRSVTGQTVSRQATGDTTNLPNIQYCARVQRDSGVTNTTAIRLCTAFETVNSIPFAGQTITLSFWARRGANFSATSNILSGEIITGTGTDQNVLAGGYTGAAYPTSTSFTLTTTWQRFTVTASIGATATEMSLLFYFVPTGTAGAADFFEITGVQIDVGSVALPFRRAMNTLAGELAACQRYYFRSVTGAANTGSTAVGVLNSTTAGRFIYPLPVQMRIAPTSVDISAQAAFDPIANTTHALTSPTLDANICSPNVAYFNGTVATATSGRTVFIISTSSSGFLGFSAEL